MHARSQADENTFLYESKSNLLSDNELLRQKLQEAQARLETRMEQQLQLQQQEQQQPELEYFGADQAQLKQQQLQQVQQLSLDEHAYGRMHRGTALRPTPALIHTPGFTQATGLLDTPAAHEMPAWITQRQVRVCMCVCVCMSVCMVVCALLYMCVCVFVFCPAMWCHIIPMPVWF